MAHALYLAAAWGAEFLGIIIAALLARRPLATYLGWNRPQASDVAFGIAIILAWNLALNGGGCDLEYPFDANAEHRDIAAMLRRLDELGIGYKDLNTSQSSLEDIFVGLVSTRKATA